MYLNTTESSLKRKMLYPPPSKKICPTSPSWHTIKWLLGHPIGLLARGLTIFTFLDYSGVILLWIFPITPWAKKLETYSDLPLVLNDDWTTELVCIFEGHKN